MVITKGDYFINTHAKMSNLKISEVGSEHSVTGNEVAGGEWFHQDILFHNNHSPYEKGATELAYL